MITTISYKGEDHNYLLHCAFTSSDLSIFEMHAEQAMHESDCHLRLSFIEVCLYDEFGGCINSDYFCDVKKAIEWWENQ
ncbi:Hypothetical protein KNT65_gp188 [Escherichia phage EcS1]|uniref:Uncharacterized protein n=1 Tax=Escherichia phage EcS1 TaxID=2083276 RepID=A0A2Z5ZCZ1_9CAUD|nr:Hypothetical protein KNT65_gp188 [Escherichia phage EcS1]BBC78305.1 Hypothetical protein [Escherichia phage EcS1]